MSKETKSCPYCAETIKAEAKVCRYCGRDLSPEVATDSISATVEAEPPKKRSLVKMFVGGVGVFLLLCCGLTFVAGGLSDPETGTTTTANTAARENDSSRATDGSSSSSSPDDPTPQSTPQPTAEPTRQPTAPPVDVILEEVRDMTDAQRNRYNESIKGNRVEGWQGTVEEVDEGEIFGGFAVYVDMDPNNFGYEVSIEVDEDVALALDKGQEITFSGDIDLVSDFLGTTIYITNATIE